MACAHARDALGAHMQCWWGCTCWPLLSAVARICLSVCVHHARCLNATPATPASRATLQVADFGFSKDADEHSAPNSRVGTPAYLAPEVARLGQGQKYDGQVGHQLDSFIGLLLCPAAWQGYSVGTADGVQQRQPGCVRCCRCRLASAALSVAGASTLRQIVLSCCRSLPLLPSPRYRRKLTSGRREWRCL